MPRILVVEDEPAIAESIAYSLRRDGFTVTVAPTLAAAERELAHIDLVVLDLMLPDGSGFDLIGQIRRSGQGTAVIVLSSRDGEADRVAALETGADDYVNKPFSPREIVARVRAVLRRATPAAGAAPVAHAGAAPGALPLGVDEATRRANRVRLESLAAKILAEVPGCALASDQLYREADLAIDFCEDVPPWPLSTAQAIADQTGASEIVRAIPNAAAAIRQSFTPWYAAPGVSDANKRIAHLLRVPAAVRFLSCEPLLGPLDGIVRERDGDPFVVAA